MTDGDDDDERTRVAELRGLGLLDTEPDERFDRVTRLAQRLFGVPIALVSLVDADRQWFKSVQGLDVRETPREQAFCAHAIQGDDVMHVPDATKDPRFEDNPLVTGAPDIRFYAGHPIAGPSGAKLGTLCIIDREPRDLDEGDRASLRDLAEMVEREIAALHLASNDPLTGLANRRSFETSASQLLEMCERRHVPATLLYLDLDGFKAINDSHGHEEGDRALVDFGAALTATFRSSDVIARLAGDEFAVLLPATDGADGPIRRLHEHLDDRNRGRPYALVTSIGMATSVPGSDAPSSLAGLLRAADADMYRHKHGR